MDWIKVKTNHILLEYSDLSDSEFRAWIKIMAMTANLEHQPTYEQMLTQAHHKTLRSLQDKLKTRPRTLQDILKKVLRDVQEVVIKREAWKQQKKQYREVRQIVQQDSLKMSSNHVHTQEKRREDKIIINNKTYSIPSWIKPETWEAFMEVRKKLKAPNTPHAITLLIKKLTTLKEQGFDPTEVINESISNGWRGVFPLKRSGNGQRMGGPGLPITTKEYQPEPMPDISDEERRRNLDKLKTLPFLVGKE